MEITWYGANCVALREQGITLLYDPFDESDAVNGKPGLRKPGFDVDLLVSSRRQEWKGFTDVPGDPVVISVPGQFESGGVFVHSLPGAGGDSEKTSEEAGHLIHFMDFGQTGVLHMGTHGAAFRTADRRLREELIALKTDILILPMGTDDDRDPGWIRDLCQDLEPRICIPVQFAPETVADIAPALQAAGAVPADAVKRYRSTRREAGAEGTTVVLLSLSDISRP